MVIGVDRNPARTPEGFDGERRIRTHNIDALVLGFSIGIDSQIDGHTEQVEILQNLPGYPETCNFLFLGILRRRPSQSIGRVLYLELRSARRIKPLRKKPGELL